MRMRNMNPLKKVVTMTQIPKAILMRIGRVAMIRIAEESPSRMRNNSSRIVAIATSELFISVIHFHSDKCEEGQSNHSKSNLEEYSLR
nr:MAG TPA: hypothetical protein [Caudoviricetes sp.]